MQNCRRHKKYIEKDSGKQLQIGRTPTDRKIDGLSATFLLYYTTTNFGPDHVQMTKVNFRLKVNWNVVGRGTKYTNILQFTLLVVKYVL